MLTTPSPEFSLTLFIQLIGGLALFLFGMKISADGLKRSGGDGLRRMLVKMTASPARGLALGIGTTFMTQSSSATSVILVSLVNSSLLSMQQTLPVLLGAGIGTTLTVQLIAFRLFDYALLLVAVGVFLRLASRHSGVRMAADITLGFGFIFYGMLVMSQALAPLKESRELASILLAFKESPWLALAISTLLTAIVQSSGATLAILLSFSVQSGGGDFLMTAMPLILGANLGTCITAFLGAIGSNRDAHRVALAQFLMKMAGVTAAMLLIPQLTGLTILLSGGDPVRQIANGHTIFNIGMTLLILPFTPQIARLVRRLMPLHNEERPFTTRYLDKKLLRTPSSALQGTRMELIRQATIIRRQLSRLEPLFDTPVPALLQAAIRDDKKATFLQQQISGYLNRILFENLSERNAQQAERLFLINNDLTSMGGVIVKNIIPLAKTLRKKKTGFSERGKEELDDLFQGMLTLFERFLRAMESESPQSMANIARAARRFQSKSGALRVGHLKRLVEGRRESVETSGVHLDLIDNIRHLASYVKGMCTYYIH